MNELIILSAFAIGFLFGNIWDFIVKRLSKWDNKQHQELQYFKQFYIDSKNNRDKPIGE